MILQASNVVKQLATGEVFTRGDVVDYMLREISSFGNIGRWLGMRVLEPSCGAGAFVIPLVKRIALEVEDWGDSRLDSFLSACDISEANIKDTREQAKELLMASGCPAARAESLGQKWFLCTDFLLHDFRTDFDVVVGNPPYIRFDDLSPNQQTAYKARYSTFTERCDIYVPFFEKSLSLLSGNGILAFICSNRFTKSSYGKRLRSFIASNYRVALYLNMEHTRPFEKDVSAYPAIYVIDRRKGEKTLAATIRDASAKMLLSCLSSNGSLSVFDHWYHGEAPWISTDSGHRKLTEEVFRTYPVVEHSAKGTQIGIGVASGADEIYIDAQKRNEVERECLLPLVTAEDIHGGIIEWHNHYILNPFDDVDDRMMRDLLKYPKMAAYLDANSKRLKARYCARKHPNSWYRTLDRINYRVLRSPKLLLPDIQGGGNVALDEKGFFYPHHNVYWIVSAAWNLRALCVIMRSSFVTEQIKSVSQELRGGFIRYQAQNLRNVHIPSYESLETKDVNRLASLYEETDYAKIDDAVNFIVKKAASRQRLPMRQLELFADHSTP